MRRHRTTWLALVALVLLLAGAARDAAAQEKPSDDASKEEFFKANEEVAASQILATWATKFDALLIQDPQVATIRIKFLTNTKTVMTWGAIKQILDFYDVVIVESQPTPGGPWYIRAHHRRSISQKEGPPWRYVEGKDVPDHDEIVTAVFQIKNGAANSIFATVRGLQTRDTNRIGNILYVMGPEKLIICDLGPQVAYYRRVAAELDTPPRSVMLEAAVFVVKRAVWGELKALPEATRSTRLRALAAEGKAELMHEASVPSRDGRFALKRRSGGWSLIVAITPQAAPGQGQPVAVAPLEAGALELQLSVEAGEEQAALTAPIVAPTEDGAVRTVALSFGKGDGAAVVVVTLRAVEAR
jgi:hypothetical protein